MSESFWSLVPRFFHLLDLTFRGSLNRPEVQICLDLTFDAVQGAKQRDQKNQQTQEWSKSEREAAVQAQLSWLFTAAGSSSSISLDDFRSCYSSLLQSAYEEEVLKLDLERAIETLESSSQYKQMRQLFVDLSSFIPCNVSDLFVCVTGKSKSLGPKKQKEARKLVEQFMKQTNENKEEKKKIQEDIKRIYLELLVLGVSSEELAEQVQREKERAMAGNEQKSKMEQEQ
jgi:hypothetical protein